MSTLRERVSALMPRAVGDLERLVRIPSVAFPGFPIEPVHEAAGEVAALLRSAGVDDARLIEMAPGGAPAVYGTLPAPPGAPTVLLYAHYDVQPAGPGEAWSSQPFEPTQQAGCLVGRGTADDKNGVVTHVTALRAFEGRPPVGVAVVVEGDEECGGSLEPFVLAHPHLFTADAVVVSDLGNVRVGEPTLTTALRGLCALTVDVRTLRAPVHSGMFGGPVPDALMVLIRMLASLHDEAGDVAVPGLDGGGWAGPDPEPADLRAAAGMLPDVPFLGTGTLGTRLWAQPSINVIGIDAPPVAGAANALVPLARATVSVRIPPAADPSRCREAVEQHLRRGAPPGVQVEITTGPTGAGYQARTDGPVYAAARDALQEAYGRPVVTMGQGGSIPLVNALASVAPEAEILLVGSSDPAARIHAPNERLDLAELERSILAEVLLLERLGRR